jgi:pimeloyl-ACP methyl ester carboxylesterase
MGFARIVTRRLLLISLLIGCGNPSGKAGDIAQDAAASDSQPTRGTVLDRTSLGSKTRAEIFQRLGGIAKNDVAFHRIRYRSIGVTGQADDLSALLAIPVGVPGPLPLLSYQHGTIVRRSNAPSTVDLAAPPSDSDVLLVFIYAASGFATVAPDYIGFGLSEEAHPYLHAASEASAVVDALRAARRAAGDLGVVLTDKIFLAGFSQGGHATMAAQRSIEQDYADELKVTASAPMDGPLDLSGVTLEQTLAGKPYPAPFLIADTLLSYNHVYGLGVTDSGLFQPEAAALPSLFDGNHSSGEINLAMLPVNVAPPKDPLLSLDATFLASLRQDEQHPLRIALQQNDVYDWSPRAPIRIYHCSGDDYVSPANAEVAVKALASRGGDVKLVDPSPGNDHIGCAGPSAMMAEAWFESLR